MHCKDKLQNCGRLGGKEQLCQRAKVGKIPNPHLKPRETLLWFHVQHIERGKHESW
jgi:hypothetical protein